VSSGHLPNHWTTTSLENIVTALEAGKSFRCIEQPPVDKEPGVVKVSAVSWGSFNEQESKTCPSDKQFNPNYQIHPGDLLISRANTIELVGACVIVGSVAKRLMLSDKILRILVADELKPWILWYLRSRDGRAQIEARSTGNQLSMRNIGQASLLSIPIPLAPNRERLQVVEAIESYLTRLDDAMATLERVQRNLKRYRASVLKAAVEGRLMPTEAELARAKGREYEPASVLLERILAERRRRWEDAEMAKMKAKGKLPKNDKWKAKYVEPVAPEMSELPELPEGWCWSFVDELGEISGGVTQNARRSTLGLEAPYLRVANVYANELRLDEVKTIGITEAELSRVLLAPGDLLIVEGNGSVEQIGRVALWDGSIRHCIHQNHLIKVRFPIDGLSRWSLYCLLSPMGRISIERSASSTSGLHTLSLSKVGRLVVPVAPMAEQLRVSSEVERLTSLALVAESEVTSNIRRITRLRQCILKWAFEGRLVDQDPSDEPAEVLLERIRAERMTKPARSTRQRRQAAGAGEKRP
jgi:type I restriction enzyme S subunit